VIPAVQIVLVKYTNDLLWTERDKKLAMPLVHVGRYLLQVMRDRVTSGIGPDGAPWSDLSKSGRWFWAPATERPGRGVVRLSNGKPMIAKSGIHAGQMAYESFAAYKRSRGGKDARNFVLSGQMMRSLRVRVMSPTRVRVSASGRRTGGTKENKAPTNAQVAKWANRKERVSILQPSKREIANAAKIVRRLVSAQWHEQAGAAEIEFDARKAAHSAKLKITRAGNVLTQLTGG